MKNKIISLVTCFVFINILFMASVQTAIIKKNENTNIELNSLLDGGWVDEINGVKILHVQGTYYQMGYQHGYLLKDQCIENLRATLNCSERGLFGSDGIKYERLLEMWDEMKEYIAQDYINEMHGLADGTDVSFENVSAAYMVFVWIDMLMAKACNGIAAWGDATVDGNLYHARSCDLPPVIKDPVTGKYAHENWVLIIREPDEGYASISPSIVGTSHMGGGVNENGISVGLQVCTSQDNTLSGTPAWMKCIMILDHASDINEAIDIIISNKTLGWNYVLSDAKIPIGYAVETTGNHSYVGTYNDVVESKHPFTEVSNVVRRTNFFIDPVTASTQRTDYDIAGFTGFIKFLLGKNIYFTIWRIYKSTTKQIEKNWGNINLNTSMEILRTVYSMKTDLFMLMFSRSINSFSMPWNQWVYCHETGEFVVSFADKINGSWKNPVHYFKFDELIDLEPTIC